MNTIQAEGKTVDEAIYNGLVSMGRSIDEVDIEVIKSGSKGFLGIGGKVVVKLTEKEHESILDEILREEKEKQQGPPVRNDHPTVRAQSTQEPREKRTRGGRDRNRRDQGDRKKSFSSSSSRDVVQRIPAGERLETCPEKEFLAQVLQHMGMQQTVIDAVDGEDGARYLLLSGPGMGLLIGRRGETLNALQYLVSIFSNKGEEDYRRCVVDTENYREKRETALVQLARRKAQEVKNGGHDIEMEPMPAQERRILHAEIQNIPGVTTRSEGEEPNRFVVIMKE